MTVDRIWVRVGDMVRPVTVLLCVFAAAVAAAFMQAGYPDWAIYPATVALVLVLVGLGVRLWDRLRPMG